MDTKEITDHLRARIKASGIKARVRFWPNGHIQVFVPAPNLEFSEADQRVIRKIAVCYHLTWVRGRRIDVDQMTNPQDFSFYIPEHIC